MDVMTFNVWTLAQVAVRFLVECHCRSGNGKGENDMCVSE